MAAIARRRALPRQHFVAVVVLGAVSVVVACNTGDSPPAATKEGPAACAGQALSSTHFTGSTLAAKQLALTFDDGSGSQTLVLSAYLNAQGIRAAFFVNGHCFAQNNPCGNPGTPAATIFTQLAAHGHLISNHTQDHTDLTSTGSFPNNANGDNAIIAELADTDAIIAPYVDHNRFLFRPPFGAWNARDYNLLHASAMDKYVGPVRWDVGGQMSGTDGAGFGADWDCWQNRSGFGVKTSAQCGNRYLNEIRAVGRGIVLMHDSDLGNMTNHDVNAGKGNTIDMVKYIIPILKQEGYTFVRPDEVPALDAVLPPIPPPMVVPDAGPGPGVDASVPPGTSGTSGTSGTPGTPGSGKPPATLGAPRPDPCAGANPAPKEYPYSAQVH